MPKSENPNPLIQNRLLAALPGKVYEQFASELEFVPLALGDVLYEAGKPIADIYFPNDGMVSLTSTEDSNAIIEIGVIGSEGMVGIAAFLGGGQMPNRAIVQISGSAMRICAEQFNNGFLSDAGVQKSLLRYTQALMTQISQTAVCNRIHSLEARFTRWLLLSHDRAASDEFMLTQEFIAYMLGASRQSVSEAASRLQDANLIYYVRGKITILDRAKIESATCNCYRIVKDEFNRLSV
ncbi:MAG: Crp/Fnr family transcriptional regulator [Acidobacteria bacterium]|nr:Crp/Fnr family transcriptional regulator [Acidobacteriota bacterium]